MSGKRKSGSESGPPPDKQGGRLCYGSDAMFLKSLGARLRTLREEQDLRVEKVCALLDVSRSHFHGIEAGENRPSVALLEDLARLYKVDECDLVTFPDEGIKHNIREELRKIPSVQHGKLTAILNIVRNLVAAEESFAEVADQAVADLRPRPRRQRRTR